MATDANAQLITGELDQADIAEGGDGIVYAGTREEAESIRALIRAQGFKLHGIDEVDNGDRS